MVEKLRNILDEVNGWLRFAEGKNALLFGADSAAIVGLINILSGTDGFFYAYLKIAIAFLTVSSLFCLFSFLPRLKVPWIAARGKPSPTDNLLYFGDIAMYTPNTYLDALFANGESERCDWSRLERHYAQQIVNNSKIGLAKYRYFTFAIWMTVSAVITPILALVVYLLRTDE